MQFFIKRDNESAPVTTPEQCALFGELDPVPVCFLQLVGKQYPLKVVSLTKKKKDRKKADYQRPRFVMKLLFGKLNKDLLPKRLN